MLIVRQERDLNLLKEQTLFERFYLFIYNTNTACVVLVILHFRGLILVLVSIIDVYNIYNKNLT